MIYIDDYDATDAYKSNEMLDFEANNARQNPRTRSISRGFHLVHDAYQR